MTYRSARVVCAAVALSLFVVLLTLPTVIYGLLDLARSDAVDVLARRASILFLGLGVVAWTGRDAPPSKERAGTSLGVAIVWLGLAVLGAWELAAGRVGPGIGIAIAAEVVLGGTFAAFWLQDRRTGG